MPWRGLSRPAQNRAVTAPLSHHRILELVAPFVRAGHALDLAGSDRAAGRLVFRPREHAAAPGHPACREQLVLAPGEGAAWRLQRELVPAGAEATPETEPARAWAEGDDVATLVAQIDALPLARQFLALPGAGHATLQHRLDAQGRPVLRGAQARLAGLQVQLKVSGVKGYPAEITLTRRPDDTRRLPDDLLEVQGRAWTRLTPLRTGWEAAVQLRGEGAARGAHAESRLAELAAHLVQTLAEPPARFHERHRAARWRVGLLRGLPLSVGLAVVAVAFAVRGRGDAAESTLAALANLVPPLLMALFFMRREMPRIELPRWPRRPPAGAWTPWPTRELP